MKTETKALVVIIIVSFLWSTAGVAAKILVKDINPIVVAFYRFFIASLIMLPFYLRTKKTKLNLKSLIFPSIIGALNVPFYFSGIKITTANSAVLIYTAGPLVTAVLSYFLIKEKNSLTKWIGIVLGLIGVITIILLPVTETGQSVSGNFGGNLMIASGMISWTLYTIWSRYTRAANLFSALTTTSIYFFISTIICFILVIINKQHLFSPILLSPTIVLTLAYSAIFITVITYFLFQWAIEHVGATTASFKQYLETIFAVILNTILLGEKITLGLIIGGLLVFVGLSVATFGKIRNSIKSPR